MLQYKIVFKKIKLMFYQEFNTCAISDYQDTRSWKQWEIHSFVVYLSTQKNPIHKKLTTGYEEIFKNI